MTCRRAIEDLYPELRRYARAIARDAASGDDLAQSAVVRALAHPGAPDEPEALRPWLFRVVRNLQVDDWRRERTRREYREGLGRLLDEGPAGSVEDDVLGRRAFERLSPAHREVLVLVDVLGHSYAEAAGIVGVARGTIMSRVSRARAAMTGVVIGEPDASDAPDGERDVGSKAQREGSTMARNTSAVLAARNVTVGNDG